MVCTRCIVFKADHCLFQVTDEDDAAMAADLADKLEAAVVQELILPDQHKLTPDPNSLLFAEIE